VSYDTDTFFYLILRIKEIFIHTKDDRVQSIRTG